VIVAERKPLDQIKERVQDYKKLLILGCGTCVSVCMAGGEKEVELLATQLRMANKIDGKDVEIVEATIQRQCDKEYIEPIMEKAKGCDAVLSLGCGAGVQMVAQMLEPEVVVPGLNTRFIGVTLEEGVWAERCRACGDCVLGETAGICPISMCAKESSTVPAAEARMASARQGRPDCAWVMIIDRLARQGRLENLSRVFPIKDHAALHHPAKQVNEAYQKAEKEEVHAK